jgi:drug/metabolite transporter (DMT)-like permease
MRSTRLATEPICRPMVWRYALLLIGVFACSTSVIAIRVSEMHPSVLTAGRLLLAVILLAPLFWRDLKRNPGAFTRAHLRRTHVPALVLAVHFICWTNGARMTFAAQATLIVNLAPIAIPFFLHYLVGEKINAREIVGTAIALAGVILLGVLESAHGAGDGAGNLLCFAAMLLFAWYLALGRKNRDFASLWLYVVPVYLQAGLLCLALAIPHLAESHLDTGREWVILLSLAVGPTILGHSLINYSLRHLRGQIVSLCNVGQFVFAGAMAYVIFAEHPSRAFYASSIVVLSGIAVVVLSSPSTPPRLR